MASTVFVSGTTIASSWLNDVNTVTYLSGTKPYVNITTLGAVAGTDITTTMNTATATYSRIYVPAGTWILNNALLPTGVEIFGDGNKTIFRKPVGSQANPLFQADSGSTSTANNINNIYLHDFQVDGQSDSLGFQQFHHLIAISGVTNVTIERIFFRAFQGDGLYIGSSLINGTTERHNLDVTVRKCIFDGINKSNRNGISIIDGDGVEIYDNVFQNCTDPSMPGPIDIEPDSNAFPIIRNITIRDNRFRNCSGMAGQVGMFIPSTVTQLACNITVENNGFYNYTGTGSSIFMQGPASVAVGSPSNAIKISNNYGSVGYNAFALNGVKGVELTNNFFDFYTASSYIGFGSSNLVTEEIFISKNTFRRMGSTGAGIGVVVTNGSFLYFHGNSFSDCGTGSVGTSIGVDFSGGSSSFIDFQDNIFEAPGSIMLTAVQIEGSHTPSPTTNKFYRNTLNGLGNSFKAQESDTINSTYSPVVVGSSTAGTGTQTLTYSSWRRVGSTVFFEVEMTYSAGHTGTGNIVISLPLTVKSIAGNPPITVFANGVSSTGGQIGLINSAQVAGGVTGALTLYCSATGAQAPIAIPAGAFTVYAKGSYETSVIL